MRIVAKNWENNSNKIKELENRIIAKIWSIIILSLPPRAVWVLECTHAITIRAECTHAITIRAEGSNCYCTVHSKTHTACRWRGLSLLCNQLTVM